MKTEEDLAIEIMEVESAAAKLLCAMVAHAPSLLLVPLPILQWYQRHQAALLDAFKVESGASFTRENVKAIEGEMDRILGAIAHLEKQ